MGGGGLAVPRLMMGMAVAVPCLKSFTPLHKATHLERRARVCPHTVDHLEGGEGGRMNVWVPPTAGDCTTYSR